MTWHRKFVQLDTALLGLALTISILLNWRSFVHEYLDIDEHISFWIADGSSPSHLLNRSYNYSATPPLSFMLQRLSLQAFGRHEWALRLPGAVSFLGSVVAVWCLGRNWNSPLAGGLAALLMASHPTIQKFAVIGRPYNVGLLVGVIAMLCTNRLADRPASRGRWAVWFLVNFALVQTHYLYAPLWAAQLLWLALPTNGGLSTVRRLSIAVFLLLLLAATACLGMVRVWEYRQLLNWTTYQPTLADLWRFIMPLEQSRYSLLMLAVAFVALLSWMLASDHFRPASWLDAERWRRLKAFRIKVAAWFLVPVASVWLLGRFWLPSLATERYLVVYLPALAILLGSVIASLRGHVAPLLAAGAILLGQGAVPRLLAAQRPIHDAVNAGWTIGWGGPCHLLLVSSGLVEMKLVPIDRDDSIFHDYVSCRVGRMYHEINAPKLSLPMRWTDDMPGFYRQAIARARAEASPDGPATIWLYYATDTDLLRDTAALAEALLKSLGAEETYRNDQGPVQIVRFQFL